MTPAIFRHQKWIPDGNNNIISNGGGLIPIIETESYGRSQSHINCLRVSVLSRVTGGSGLVVIRMCGCPQG